MQRFCKEAYFSSKSCVECYLPVNFYNSLEAIGIDSSRFLFRFQTAYERFPTKNFCLNTRWVNETAVLVAQKGKSKAEQVKENYEKDKKDILEAVGFSKVIKHLSNSVNT